MTTLLRLPAVLDRTGLSRSKLYELVQSGQFPRPIKQPGGRLICFADNEVDAWIKARLAEREAA